MIVPAGRVSFFQKSFLDEDSFRLCFQARLLFGADTLLKKHPNQ